MVRFWIVPLVLCLVLIPHVLQAEHHDEGEWTVLFDGTDLAHWDIVAGGKWSIHNGVLTGSLGEDWTTNPEVTGSYLRSKKEYTDFVLRFEYAINENGNSGVFFRSAEDKNPAFTGYEMQITDSHGKEVNQYNSGIYDYAAPSKNMVKPAGEWNEVELTAKGHTITVVMNGEKIVDLTGDRRLSGYIGLQNHDEHSVVKYRNIKIMEL